MGLKDTIKSAVGSGFTALGDLKTTVTFKTHTANPSYNPTTQAISESSTSVSVTGVLARYNRRQIDGQVIQPNDQKFLFLQSAITFSPTLIDSVIISGAEWQVIDVSKDPADAIWVMQIRQAG